MNEIILKKDNLPSNIKDLTKFVLIGREKPVSVRAEIRAIDKIDLATEVREQKKNEAQDLASALLDAEVKIGELLSQSPSRYKVSSRTATESLPEGITKFQSHHFQTLASNKDVEIPTSKEFLLSLIDAEKKYALNYVCLLNKNNVSL